MHCATPISPFALHGSPEIICHRKLAVQTALLDSTAKIDSTVKDHLFPESLSLGSCLQEMKKLGMTHMPRR